VLFGVSKLFHRLEVPEINFTSQVAKSSDHGNLRKRANPNGVPKSFAEFLECLTVLVVESGGGRLQPR
jgi:hypothetical protein